MLSQKLEEEQVRGGRDGEEGGERRIVLGVTVICIVIHVNLM